MCSRPESNRFCAFLSPSVTAGRRLFALIVVLPVPSPDPFLDMKMNKNIEESHPEIDKKQSLARKSPNKYRRHRLGEAYRCSPWFLRNGAPNVGRDVAYGNRRRTCGPTAQPEIYRGPSPDGGDRIACPPDHITREIARQKRKRK